MYARARLPRSYPFARLDTLEAGLDQPDSQPKSLRWARALSSRCCRNRRGACAFLERQLPPSPLLPRMPTTSTLPPTTPVHGLAMPFSLARGTARVDYVRASRYIRLLQAA